MYERCKKAKCCCKTVISKKGITGPRGPRGPRGADGPPGPIGNITRVVGQSAFWAGIGGPVGTTGVGTLFSSLESNFFNPTLFFYVLSLGLTVTAGAQHTVKAYFKKNGVQVGPTYEKTMFPKDYLFFETELIPFINGDLLDLYIESTALDCQVQPGHLIHYRQ